MILFFSYYFAHDPYYDPKIGRFMSEDPFSFKLGAKISDCTSDIQFENENNLPVLSKEMNQYRYDYQNRNNQKTTTCFNENPILMSHDDLNDEKENFQKSTKDNFRKKTSNEKTSEELAIMIKNYLENPQNLSTYAYALNNPLKNIDPTGELTEETTKTIIENSILILSLGIFTAFGGEAMIYSTGTYIVKLGLDIVVAVYNDPDVQEIFSEDEKIDN